MGFFVGMLGGEQQRVIVTSLHYEQAQKIDKFYHTQSFKMGYEIRRLADSIYSTHAHQPEKHNTLHGHAINKHTYT